MDKKKEELLKFFSPTGTVRGGKSALAKALGKTPQALNKWGMLDGKIPKMARYEIERLRGIPNHFTFEWLSKIKWKD